jgi:hypothetical protein
MEDIVSLVHPRISILMIFEEALPSTTCPPEEFGVHAAGSFSACGDFNSSWPKGRKLLFLGEKSKNWVLKIYGSRDG